MNAGARLLKSATDRPLAQVSAGTVVLAYALAFAQRTGRTFTDTRIEFTIDPVRFLHAVSSMWSPTGDLGHVQSGEFVGYLTPMAPWYAFAHTIGLTTWIAQRIWLGTLLALAGIGVARFVAALHTERAPVAMGVASLLYIANPYVVVVSGRASAWLVTYAALPWVLLAVHRGIRTPTGWRWPASIGLVMLLANGGVNAALPFWMTIAALALVVYEVVVMRATTWRASGRFALRAVLCVALLSLWWVVPALLTTRYAPNFLSFTEQPLTILATPSASESLRLLGYWVVYFGVGGGPATPSTGASAYLFEPLVIVATFLVPLIAFAGFGWTRRWAYAAFFVLLGAGALIVMTLGFPPGSPINRLLVPAYYHVGPLQILRTTWKAAPLLALALACLGGLALEAAADWLRAARRVPWGRLRIPAVGLVALLPIPVLWAWPMFNGTAIDSSEAYGAVPHYWHAALGDATRATTTNQRIMVLPGELFGWYRWGETVDSALPFLTPRRLTIREIERHSDLRASQLQIAVDDLVQQDRLVSGQLTPLLRLFGVGSVLVSSDGNLSRDGALDPVDVARALRDQAPLTRPVKSYGRPRTYLPQAGRDGPAMRLPSVRRYAVPGTGTGVVRVHLLAGTTVLDGDGYGVAELAADGMLDPRRALVYPGDLRHGQLSGLAAAGTRLVFSDSNRLRIVEPSTTAQDLGPTLAPGDMIAPDTPYYSLFPRLGAAGETIAADSGLRYLRTPGIHRGNAIFPESRPYAALDGRLDTAWVPDPQAPPSQRYLELELRRPRAVSSISLYPLGQTAVAVSVNGRPAWIAALRSGWNRIPITTEPLRRLRITVYGVTGLGAAGGISELRIPGLQVREALRLPTDLAARARRLDLSHDPILVLLARTTADFPYREHPATQVQSILDAQDPERDVRRIVTLPASRSFTLSGWASVGPDAPDPRLDQLAGMRPGWTFASSDRYEGVPINRASSAFDGNPRTAWVAHFVAAQAIYPWIQVSWPTRLTVRSLLLVRGARQYEFPRLVRVSAPGARPQDVPVGADGTVRLSRALRTRTLRLQVRDVLAPIGTAESERSLDAAAIAEIRVPGLRPPSIPRQGGFTTRCGELSLRAGTKTLPAVVSGTLAALDQGEPLRLQGCGARPRLRLDAAANSVYAPAGKVMQPDHLALTSPAPAPLPRPPAETVAGAGSAHAGNQDGVRPGVSAPSWLVLGEGYSAGWQAWCRSRSGRERALGPARPIDGYANGWRIGPGCASARMAFVPQRAADLALLISGLATGLMLLLALGARLRLPVWRRRLARRAAEPPGVPTVVEVPARSLRYGLLTAAAWGVGVELFGALVFAPRFGVVVGPLTFVLVLLGIGVGRLVGLASVAILTVPLLYITRPASHSGAAFYFPLEHLAAHWLTAGATLAMAGAAALQCRGIRSRSSAELPSSTQPGPGKAVAPPREGRATGARSRR